MPCRRPLAIAACFAASLYLLESIRPLVASAAEEVRIKDVGKEPKLTVVTITSHCDWAWIHSRAWHEGRYAEMIRRYLAIMRENPDYVWQVENVNEQLLPFLAKARRDWPGLVDEFWQGVKQGRIEVVVGYSNPRISEVYPEIFVRNLVLGKQYFRRHAPGLRQPVYNAVDVMGGSSQMPQILQQADYRYFMFQRGGYPQVTFWRKGLDGSRILTSRNQSVAYDPFAPVTDYGRVVQGIQPVPIWRIGVGMDDVLPDPTLLKKAAAWDPQKKIISTVARYFEECEKYGGQLTELEGPLDSHGYYTAAALHGNHNIYMHNNRNEDLLLSLEKAQVMATVLGRSYFNEPMDGLWQDILSCTGHAIEWIWKDDYDERMAQVGGVRARARRALEEALSAVSSSIPFRYELGTPLVAFNFHAWPVSGPVQFTVEDAIEGLVLRDSAGKEVALQAVGEEPADGRRLAFVASDVPACGFKTYYLSRAKQGGPAAPAVAAGDGAIENEYYRIAQQPNGRLDVVDKSSGKTLGAPQVGGLGDLALYELPPTNDWVHNGPAGRRHDWQPMPGRCEARQGPAIATLRCDGAIGPHAVVREVRLWRGSRRIGFHVEIDAKGDNGIVCIRFPVGMAGKVVAGIPFGVEPRENFEKEPFRYDGFIMGFPEGYDAVRWTDVSSPEFGYTFVCPQGMHSGYAFKKQDRSLEFILHRLQPMPKDIFRQSHPSLQGKGHHEYDCALVPHPATWRESLAYRDALAEHVPLVAYSPSFRLDRGGVCEKEKPERPQPDAPRSGAMKSREAASIAEVSPASVVLSSMRLVPSGRAGQAPQVELRVYETTGSPADVVVRLGCPVSRVQETNFLGEPIAKTGKIDAAGNEVRLHILPWKIVNLRVTLGIQGDK
jgi:alpha-mannosidase